MVENGAIRLDEASIIHEGNLDHGFLAKVAAFPGAAKIEGCIQCGTCSGSCQLAQDMDYTPRRLVEMIRDGLSQRVLSSKAIWYCASCYACTARCPKGIKLTEIMYALRSLALAGRHARPRDRGPAFYRSFFDVFLRLGRLHEGALILLTALRTNPFSLFALAPLGLRMLRAGKIGLLPRRARGVGEIRRMLAAARLEGGDTVG